MKFLFLLVILLVLFSAYARLSPVRPSIRHDIPLVDKDTAAAGGFTAVREISGDADDVLARLTKIILATPRTSAVDGAPLRFVTRSRLMGFADIATVEMRGGNLVIHSHLTLGKSDMGVNKARVLGWLAQLGAL